MKSIRDLVNRMPETKKGLEDYVLNYDPDLKESVEKNPRGRQILEDVVNKSYEKYSPHIGGLVNKISGAGHAVGHAADAYALSGNIVGALGGKALNLIAQIPEKAYSLWYGAKTGDYLGSMQNIFEGLISYLPGFTIADQGLSRIVQKRMAKTAIKDLRRQLKKESSQSDKQDLVTPASRSHYKDARDRSGNIIDPGYVLTI